jgi:hypothetical protein
MLLGNSEQRLFIITVGLLVLAGCAPKKELQFYGLGFDKPLNQALAECKHEANVRGSYISNNYDAIYWQARGASEYLISCMSAKGFSYALVDAQEPPHQQATPAQAQPRNTQPAYPAASSPLPAVVPPAQSSYPPYETATQDQVPLTPATPIAPAAPIELRQPLQTLQPVSPPTSYPPEVPVQQHDPRSLLEMHARESIAPEEVPQKPAPEPAYPLTAPSIAPPSGEAPLTSGSRAYPAPVYDPRTMGTMGPSRM